LSNFADRDVGTVRRSDFVGFYDGQLLALPDLAVNVFWFDYFLLL